MSDVIDHLDLIKKLPRRIFVEQYEFHLKLVDEGAAELKTTTTKEDGTSEEEEGDGLTDFNGRRIYFCKTLPLHRFVEVVVHEFIHAINWNRDVEDGSTEEEFTTKFSPGFVRFLLDNPRMHQWLNRAIREIRKQQANVGSILD